MGSVGSLIRGESGDNCGDDDGVLDVVSVRGFCDCTRFFCLDWASDSSRLWNAIGVRQKSLDRERRFEIPVAYHPARVAELADAPDSGSGGRKAVGVQVPLLAQISSHFPYKSPAPSLPHSSHRDSPP